MAVHNNSWLFIVFWKLTQILAHIVALTTALNDSTLTFAPSEILF